MSRRSIPKITEPSYEDLLERLRARGFTLRSFALTHGYKVPTAYDAARRVRRGKKSLPIYRHLKQFAYES